MEYRDFILEKLKEHPRSLDGRNEKALNFSEDSDSYEFYTKQYQKGKSDFPIGLKVKDSENLSDSPVEMQEIINYLRDNISEDKLILELGGSRYQRRSGYPYHFLKNYVPLDISLSSMVAYSEQYDRPSIAADAQSLPFKNESVDVVFSHDFLEHPLNPEKVVEEIDRILKVGGVVIHSDAWHCRWWHRYGVYKVKKWKDMSVKEKLLTMVIIFTEFKGFRFPIIITRRFFRELFISKKSPNKLLYKKLRPNYDIVGYSDEHAAGSLDPVDLIRFYESRGYKLITPSSFFQKLFYNKKNMFLIKL